MHPRLEEQQKEDQLVIGYSVAIDLRTLGAMILDYRCILDALMNSSSGKFRSNEKSISGLLNGNELAIIKAAKVDQNALKATNQLDKFPINCIRCKCRVE